MNVKFISYFRKTYSVFSIGIVILFFSEEIRDMQLLLIRISISNINVSSMLSKFHGNIRFFFYLVDSCLFINAAIARTLNVFFSLPWCY